MSLARVKYAYMLTGSCVGLQQYMQDNYCADKPKILTALELSSCIFFNSYYWVIHFMDEKTNIQKIENYKD